MYGTDSIESPPIFTRGDIVWVKLSGCWWPGEVKNQEDLPEDLLSNFKKPPLVIVKFFDEDSYEYIKNWSHIYHYNCERKSDFIKKGMVGYRAKISHMSKFPKDVGTAEEKTNGNPNILSLPEFLPVKKINYDEIFGSPSSRKPAKGKISSIIKKTPKDTLKPIITHRRFLGKDDYRAYICLQYPGKDLLFESDEEEIKKMNEEPTKEFNCSYCTFKTKRLEVMILHTKMHYKVSVSTPKRKTDKIKNSDTTDSESDSDIKSPKLKQRKKKEIRPKTKSHFKDLLDEWDDSDEEDISKSSKNQEKHSTTEKHSHLKGDKCDGENNKPISDGQKTISNSKKQKSPGGSKNVETAKVSSVTKNTQDDIKNCFDFDEEEEDEEILLPTSIGRKIPRVIPEKPKPSISELLEESEKADESKREKPIQSTCAAEEPSTNRDEVNKEEILRISESFNRVSKIDESINKAFKDLMQETSVPSLGDFPHVLKPEQNFHDAGTIKFPDKGGTPSKSGTSLNTEKPIRRFVTSFEDFEAGFRKLEAEERKKTLDFNKEVKVNELASEVVDNKKQLSVEIDQTKEIRESSLEVSDTKESDLHNKTDSEPAEIVEKTEQEFSVSLQKPKEAEMDKETEKHEESDPQEHKLSNQLEAIQEANDKNPVLDFSENKRKSRRKTKQFIVEENSEHIIDFQKGSDDCNNSIDNVADVNEEAKKTCINDAEEDTSKRSLEEFENEGEMLAIPNEAQDSINADSNILTTNDQGEKISKEFGNKTSKYRRTKKKSKRKAQHIELKQKKSLRSKTDARNLVKKNRKGRIRKQKRETYAHTPLEVNQEVEPKQDEGFEKIPSETEKPFINEKEETTSAEKVSHKCIQSPLLEKLEKVTETVSELVKPETDLNESCHKSEQVEMSKFHAEKKSACFPESNSKDAAIPSSNEGDTTIDISEVVKNVVNQSSVVSELILESKEPCKEKTKRLKKQQKDESDLKQTIMADSNKSVEIENETDLSEPQQKIIESSKSITKTDTSKFEQPEEAIKGKKRGRPRKQKDKVYIEETKKIETDENLFEPVLLKTTEHSVESEKKTTETVVSEINYNKSASGRRRSRSKKSQKGETLSNLVEQSDKDVSGSKLNETELDVCQNIESHVENDHTKYNEEAFEAFVKRPIPNNKEDIEKSQEEETFTAALNENNSKELSHQEPSNQVSKIEHINPENQSVFEDNDFYKLRRGRSKKIEREIVFPKIVSKNKETEVPIVSEPTVDKIDDEKESSEKCHRDELNVAEDVSLSSQENDQSFVVNEEKETPQPKPLDSIDETNQETVEQSCDVTSESISSKNLINYDTENDKNTEICHTQNVIKEIIGDIPEKNASKSMETQINIPVILPENQENVNVLSETLKGLEKSINVCDDNASNNKEILKIDQENAEITEEPIQDDKKESKKTRSKIETGCVAEEQIYLGIKSTQPKKENSLKSSNNKEKINERKITHVTADVIEFDDNVIAIPIVQDTMQEIESSVILDVDHIENPKIAEVSDANVLLVVESKTESNDSSEQHTTKDEQRRTTSPEDIQENLVQVQSEIDFPSEKCVVSIEEDLSDKLLSKIENGDLLTKIDKINKSCKDTEKLQSGEEGEISTEKIIRSPKDESSERDFEKLAEFQTDKEELIRNSKFESNELKESAENIEKPNESLQICLESNKPDIIHKSNPVIIKAKRGRPRKYSTDKQKELASSTHSSVLKETLSKELHEEKTKEYSRKRPSQECEEKEPETVKISEETSSEKVEQQLDETQSISIPLKKNKWSRHSISKKDVSHDTFQDKIDVVSENVSKEEQLSTEESKKIGFPSEADLAKCVVESEKEVLEKSCVNLDNELILPLKKSKRFSDACANLDEIILSETQFDRDNENFYGSGENITSTALKNSIPSTIDNNIDKSIILDTLEKNDVTYEETCEKVNNDLLENSNAIDLKEIRKEPDEILKCVPPKKKKIDVPRQDAINLQFKTITQSETSKVEEIPQPPKKKMQKLFESTQALEKLEKSADIPLMSPLAKKKSFLFQQHEYALKTTEITVKESEKDKDPVEANLLPRNSSTTIPDSSVEAEELKDGIEKERIEVDVDEFFNLPKKRKRRKSSLIENQQTEEIDKGEHILEQPEEQIQYVIQTENELLVSKPEAEANDMSKETAQKNEMEVKMEQDDFKFCIKTNLSNIATLEAEELSVLATETLSDMRDEVSIGLSIQNTELEQQGNNTQEKEEVIGNEELNATKTETNLDSAMPTDIKFPSESELVPIEGTLTIMSEKDLADAQVEITPDKVISEKKPMTLGSFSMDFSETSLESCNSKPFINVKKGNLSKNPGTIGTEFPPKAITKDFDNRPLTSRPNVYSYKSELIDILEGNSNSSTNSSSGSEQKFKTSFDNYDKKNIVSGMFDFEDAIPSQIVLSNKIQSDNVLLESPKLLERLSMSTEVPKTKSQKVVIQSDVKVNETPKTVINKISKPLTAPKPAQKIVIKTTKLPSGLPSKMLSGSKPIILSEQIIRPANTTTMAKQIQLQGVKRQFEDIEDVETAFIIPKIAKKSVEEEVIAVTPEKIPKSKNFSKTIGKAKIIQQTIITSKGEIIQPQTATTTTQPTLQTDDTIFDINSMPIVISDDLLTPESIQNMPVVLSEEVTPQSTTNKTQEKIIPTLVKKIVSNVVPKQQIIFKTTQPCSTTTLIGKQGVKPRILTSTATPTNKLTRPGTLLATGTTVDGKPTKYVLVPSSVTSTTTLPQGKTLKPIIKKQTTIQSKPINLQPPEIPSQVTGNKIMIVTNQHGQQHRVVLTPQQQKVLMQSQSGTKVTKTIIKGTLPKGLLESPTAGPSGIVSKPTLTVISQSVTSTSTVSTQGGLLMPVGKTLKTPVQTKKVIQKPAGKPQKKTVLIKNQLGQTLRRIQSIDDADIDRQVAEQLEAIKASAKLHQVNKTPEIINYATRSLLTSKPSGRKSYSKKCELVKVKVPQTQISKSEPIPTLTPISPQPKISQGSIIQNIIKSKKVDSTSTEKLTDSILQQQIVASNQAEIKPTMTLKGGEIKPDRPLNQLVIQDALGNQTTITEGQILALPSETVDGQPQSYMLVTLDETGNLTPLNNEALMSLDPSLGLGGDINNVVLQVDQGQGVVATVKSTETSSNIPLTIEPQKKVEEKLKSEPKKSTAPILGSQAKATSFKAIKPQELPLPADEGIVPGTDPVIAGQQLIITGDPVATQKFLESLSDGTTDLANILANAEGGSVLIQADGQQILIKTNAGDGSTMMGIGESTEGGGNPIFATHKPNQDILAAALADTDVFQTSDQQTIQSVKSHQSSQLSPGSGAPLYPMHVGNVLETSLTLSSPIMTPLEVPSTNSKKIDDEAEILSQVPKNVDLPITITDPNISQTVAQQQTAGLMELTLPIAEATTAKDMNSPTYTYPLPSLDENVGISQKPFNGSMPLLTEDITEVESNGCMGKQSIMAEKEIESNESEFGSRFGALPLLPETIESKEETVKKTTVFEDIGSLPMLTEDSASSIESTKPSRLSPKTKERDIVNEGLCTLGGEMCSSLSEPPPDMFDLGPITTKEEEISSDLSSVPEHEGDVSSPNSDGSEEIPLQPPIVATLNDLKRPGEELDSESEEKKQKYD